MQQIEEDFTAGYLQRIKDQTDKAVADTVDGWKKAIPQLEGLLKEYNTKFDAGKPTTQTSDEWEKELAQMREAIRKTWLSGMDDIFGQVDNQVFENLKKDFSIWQQGTADYLAGEIAAYERAYETIADKRDEILGATQLSGETDEQFLQRKQQKELEFDKHLYEMKRKIVEGYQNWYFKKVTETDSKIILSTRKTYEDYVKGIPHSVWDYMFKPTDNTMANMEQDLKNAETRFKDAQENIEKIMRKNWNEEEQGTFDREKAFNLLPESVQKDYLSKLEDFKDKEAALLKQRLDNWIGLGNAIGDLFGNVAEIYEEDIKNRQKKGKIDQKQAEKEFENLKALQIAQAVINTLAGSVGAFLQASEAYPAPWGQIIGGVAAASATAAGIAQIAKIKNTEYGGSGSVSTPTAAATPIVDPYQPDYTRNLTTASDIDVLNSGLEKANLYVKVTDIDDAQERGRVRTDESSW